jgi:uncharacterized membrane protein YkvA (DUF1232 family)
MQSRICGAQPAGGTDKVRMSLEFDDAGFWDKIGNFAVQAGSEVIERALWLYYAAMRPQTPPWAKTAIYAALAYFILPGDAIPDLIPVVGFSDDLGALAAAIATVAFYIDDDVRQRARIALGEWFLVRSVLSPKAAAAAAPGPALDPTPKSPPKRRRSPRKAPMS